MSIAVGSIVKNTVVYGYALSQPFAFYIDAYPMIQDELLLEAQTIQYGESGDLVQYLQLKLNNLGYYEDDLDGEYGILTEHAIKKLQSSHSLDPNGVANDETLEIVVNAEKELKLEEIESLMEDVYYGTKSDAIKEIQETLYLYGYYDYNIDSIYGPLTEKAYHTLKAEIHGASSIETITEVSSDSAPTLAGEIVKEEVDNIEIVADENKALIESEAIEDNNETPLEVKSNDVNHHNLIDVAKSYIGVQYVWGGTSTSGFDCSGYIQYVYKQNDIVVPRTVNEIWNFASPVDNPSIGDLVFFETYKSGPSHLGIYLGNNSFIHAGSSNGVEISNLDNSYWEQRYIGSKRIQ